MANPVQVEYDVAIVGAGPAGSSCAIRLAMGGLRVVLVEQKSFPREKLCGEFISPECLAHFADIGVIDQISLAGGSPIERTVFYARNARSVTVPSKLFGDGGAALGLSRSEMDLRLLERARDVGVEIYEEATATGLNVDGETVRGIKVRENGRRESLMSAAITIDATGRSKALARMIDLSHKRNPPTRAEYVAFKAHLTGADIPAGDCEIYAYRGGYGGCSRVEGGRFNLCFIVASEIVRKYGGDAVAVFQNVVLSNKQAARSLSRATATGQWLAVPITAYGRGDLTPATGLMTIGDAAAFIDPFTGSGILLALESAKIAADVLAAEFAKPVAQRSFAAISAEYHRRQANALGRRLRISSLLRYAAFVPFLAETVIKILGRSKGLTSAVARATRPDRNAVVGGGSP